MASINYTPLRELEGSGFIVSGTDISAAGSDDSFNATTTNLSGLLSGQWVNTSGFTNTVNNGWFHLNANSTSTKITQDTTTSLTTEGAGNFVTITGYKRGLNQSYSIDFNVEQADRMRSEKRSRQQALGGGQPETIFYRSEIVLNVRTGVILEANLGQWREFLASVNSGETFYFDRYGTAASPVEQKLAILETEEYTEQREGTLYPGRYRIAFTVRLLT